VANAYEAKELCFILVQYLNEPPVKMVGMHKLYMLYINASHRLDLSTVEKEMII